MHDLAHLKNQVTLEISQAETLEVLEELRINTLGKKGTITDLMKSLGSASPEERKEKGQEFNRAKDEITLALETRRAILQASALEARLAAERMDLSLPIIPEARGTIHPLTQTIEEVTSIFAQMGFVVAEGPDVESEYHNFTALNIPAEHPSRQMHDTFYMQPDADGQERVLRTHTSPVQIRAMKSMDLPLRILVPGRAFRSDYDMTHTPMFHQFEGLVIGEGIHMGHLKGCLMEFARAYFGVADLPFRFRSSYFPFTEPSVEVDIGCTRQGGEFKIGAGDSWLEILGAGMVHPVVLENCGIDPEKYQGFAFGMGVERITMLKHGIGDLRSFFDADGRWLAHYGFRPLDIPSLLEGLSA